MNYNHNYHAGNFADVVKHSVLVLLLQALLKKDKNFCFIDTHAAMGCYSLRSSEANKTLEFEQGIAKILQAQSFPKEIESYLNIISELNGSSLNDLQLYPGSSYFAQKLLRADDELILNELHPTFFYELKSFYKRDKRVSCHQRHAYEFLPAVLPPKLRRGLILIDPPYEKPDEYKQLKTMLDKALAKFANGIYVIWYPIKDSSHQAFCRKIENSVENPILRIELTKSKVLSASMGLIGTGLLIINPPWQIEVEIRKLLDFLYPLLVSEQEGECKMELVGVK